MIGEPEIRKWSSPWWETSGAPRTLRRRSFHCWR